MGWLIYNYIRTGKGPICYIDVFLGRNMPENFVYVRILQVKGDPRLRGDDKEGARG